VDLYLNVRSEGREGNNLNSGQNSFNLARTFDLYGGKYLNFARENTLNFGGKM
jgi:hypothetical protein